MEAELHERINNLQVAHIEIMAALSHILDAIHDLRTHVEKLEIKKAKNHSGL